MAFCGLNNPPLLVVQLLGVTSWGPRGSFYGFLKDGMWCIEDNGLKLLFLIIRDIMFKFRVGENPIFIGKFFR